MAAAKEVKEGQEAASDAERAPLVDSAAATGSKGGSSVVHIRNNSGPHSLGSSPRLGSAVSPRIGGQKQPPL